MQVVLSVEEIALTDVSSDQLSSVWVNNAVTIAIHESYKGDISCKNTFSVYKGADK